MNTREVAAELRQNHWAQVLRQRSESGFSIRRWCAENDVTEKTFYYWQRKLRESVCESLASTACEQPIGMAPIGWAACERAPELGVDSGAITIEIGTMRVTATTSTNLELLGKICRVLCDAAL